MSTPQGILSALIDLEVNPYPTPIGVLPIEQRPPANPYAAPTAPTVVVVAGAEDEPMPAEASTGDGNGEEG